MSDVRSKTIGPVIEKDFVVIRVSKWGCITAGEQRGPSIRRGQSLPMQSFAKDESGDRIIAGFGLVRPFDVAS